MSQVIYTSNTTSFEVTAGIVQPVIGYALENRLSLGALVPALLCCVIFGRVIYNIYFHPLRHYPGPRLWAATRLPRLYGAIVGTVHFSLLDHHLKYGDVVRVAPNELSFTASPVWKEIYGHRPDGEMMKDKKGAAVVPTVTRVETIVAAELEPHTRMRKSVAPAFSDKALKEQEGFLQKYVNQLVDKLKTAAAQGKTINMVEWYNWTTFDVIGDLSFGEPFNALKNAAYHPWISNILGVSRIIPWLQALVYFKVFFLLKYVVPVHLTKARQQASADALAKVERRLAKPDYERKDFWSYILRNMDEKGMSENEMKANAAFFILAGSETTATALSGATYHILKNPDVHAKLKKEIRDAFTSDDEITVQAVGKLRYLLAVLDESLRIYHPVPGSMARVVPGRGAKINGDFVPAGTTVGMHYFSTLHSPSNFYEPESFLPDRWLPAATSDPESPFYGDDRAAMQPFGYGARNCIAQGLAYAEMRLILAKVLWHFDLELYTSSEGWQERQRAFVLWEKIPLNVELKVRSDVQ